MDKNRKAPHKTRYGEKALTYHKPPSAAFRFGVCKQGNDTAIMVQQGRYQGIFGNDKVSIVGIPQIDQAFVPCPVFWILVSRPLIGSLRSFSKIIM